jgi:hypothetical protein
LLLNDIMSESMSTSLQIGAVFEILLLSFIGVALPFVIIYFRNMSKIVDEKPFIIDARDSIGGDTFQTMKAVSVGVMLGLALVSVKY